MRYLLDTNIISNVVKPVPSESLLDWMAARDDAELFIATLTIAEIHRGILEMPAGKRRNALTRWFSGPEGPQTLFAGRLLSFDVPSALIWSRLMAEGKAKGRPRSALDMVIAAVAEANDCFVVTDNEKDFGGVEVLESTPPRQIMSDQSSVKSKQMEQRMKKFLAVYIGTATPEQKAATVISEDRIAAGMSAWGDWMTRNAAAIVDGGGPLGKTKRVAEDGVSDTRNNLTGYVIVSAPSLEAAAAMFRDHPHFTIFLGDAVEVVECLPIPGS